MPELLNTKHSLSSWAPLIILILMMLTVGVGVTWPLALHLNSHYLQTSFSVGQHIAIGLGAEQFPYLLHTTRMGWPQTAWFAPLLWPALPVAKLIGALPTLNLLFITVPLWNALAGWALGRVLGGSPWAAAALGGLVGWNTWVFVTLGNGQLEQALIGVAAGIWAVGWWASEGGPRRWLGAGVLCLGAGLAVPHVTLVGVLGLGVLALCTPARLRAWLGIFLFVGLAMLAVYGYNAPSVDGTFNVLNPKNIVPIAPPHEQREAATLRDFVVAPAPPHTPVLHAMYLGAVTLIGAGWGLLRGPRPVVWRFAILALFLVTCALGQQMQVGALSIPTPVGVLASVVPALGRTSNPYRMVLGAIIALSALAAMTIQGWRGALLLVAGAWAEAFYVRARPIPLPSSPIHHAAVVEVLAKGSGPVLDLPPIGDAACPIEPYEYAVSSLYHQRPIYNVVLFKPQAYGDNTARIQALTAAVNAGDCSGALPTILQELAPSTIVLHQVRPPFLKCEAVTRYLSCLRTALGEPTLIESDVVWERR